MRSAMRRKDKDETGKVPGGEGLGIEKSKTFTDNEISDTMEGEEINEEVKAAIEKGRTGKYAEQMETMSDKRSQHIIEGSKKSKHKWEKLVPNKNWEDIKYIIAYVMEFGEEGIYKTVHSKKAVINGFVVEVTYVEIEGRIRISDAWVK